MLTPSRLTASIATLAVALSMLGAQAAMAAPGGPARDWRSAPTATPAGQEGRAPAASALASLPTEPSLVLTTTTAEPPPVGLAVPTGSRLHVASGQRSVLVIGVRIDAIIDRTEDGAPRIEIILPSGLVIVEKQTIADPGTTGQWSCRGGRSVSCDLRQRDGSAGWISSASRADLVLALRARGDASAAEGSITITASASGRGMSGTVTPMIADTEVEAVADPTIPPDVRFRVVRADGTASRRTVEVEVLALSSLDSAGPSVRLTDLVPAGSTAVDFEAPGWTCTPEQCARTSPLRVGQPVTVRVTFTPPSATTDLAWTIGTRYPGGSLPRSVAIPGGLPVVVLMPTMDDSDLTVALDTSKGQVITAGKTLELTLLTGGPRTQVPVSRVTAPAGTTVRVDEPGWTCRLTTCTGPGRPQVRVMLGIAASYSSPAATITAEATVFGRTVRTVAQIAVIDPGDPFPGLRFDRVGPTGPRPWTDGQRVRARVGTATDFRVWVSNSGGGEMSAGREVVVSQQTSTGVRFMSVNGPGTCRVSAASWTCSWNPPTATPVGTRLGAWSVRFMPMVAANRIALGPVRATLDTSAPVTATPDFQSVDPVLPLRISTDMPDGITAGGAAAVDVRVRPRTGSIDDLVLTGTFPAGITPGMPNRDGWNCSRDADRLTCRRTRPLSSAEDLSIPLTADRSAPTGLTRIRWSGSSPSGLADPVRVETLIAVHPGAELSALASPSSLAATDPDAKPALVMLQSTLSPNGGVWQHVWTQACITATDTAPQCADPRVATDAITLRRQHGSSAVARIPTVMQDRRFLFRITATDGSALLTRLVAVDARGYSSASTPVLTWRSTRRSAPTLRARPWMLAELAIAPSTRPTPPADVRQQNTMSGGLEFPLLVPGARALSVTIRGGAVRTGRSGQTLSLPAAASGGQGDLSYRWSLLSGSPLSLTSLTEPAPTFTVPSGVRVSAYQVTVTDVSGAEASDVVVIALNPGPSPLCALVRQAARGRIMLSRGDTVLRAASASPIGSGCGDGTGVEFSRATVTLGGLSLVNASGTATAAGIALTDGILRTPASWRMTDMAPVRGLSLAYAGESLSSRGVYRIRSFAFLPLPRQWHGRTRLILGSDESGPRTTLVSFAGGRDGGTATLRGSIARDGSFTRLPIVGESVAVVGDQTISLAGSVRHPDPNGPVTGGARGTLAQPATLVSGATVETMLVTWLPESDPALRGSGTVALHAGDTSMTATGRLRYRGSTAWDIRVSGGSRWSPVSGLTVDRISGEITSGRRGYGWNLRLAAAQDWTVTPALSVVPDSIVVTDTCPAALADDDCPAASLLASVTGTVTLDGLDEPIRVPGQAAVTLGPLPRRLVSAQLGSTLDLRRGLAVTEGRIRAREGTPESLPALADADMAVEILGAVTVPRIGLLDNVKVAVVKSGWALAAQARADLGDDGGDLSRPAIGYSTIPVTVEVDGTTPFDIVDCTSTAAAAGQACTDQFVVSGTYTAPTWVTDLVGVDNLTTLAVLSVNPVNGSLEDSFDIPLPRPLTLPSEGAASLTLDTLRMQFDSTQGPLIVTAQGAAELALPSSGNPPAMRFWLNHLPDTGEVSGVLRPVTGQEWTSAFDAAGITLGGIELSYRTGASGTSLSVTAAEVNLPDDIVSALSIPRTSSVSAGADLSVDRPCLVVTMQSSDPDAEDLVDLADGAIGAARARLIIAPDGCRIDGERIGPGYLLDIDGRTLGQDLPLTAPLTRAPLTYSPSTDLTGLELGDLLLQDARVSVDVVEDQPDSVQIEGKVEVMGSVVQASGSLTSVSGTVEARLASTADLTVDGFQLDQVALEIVGRESSTDVTGSAQLRTMGGSVVLPDLRISVDHQGLDRFEGSGPISVTLPGGVVIDADIAMDYSAATDSMDVAARGAVSSGDLQLRNALLNVAPGCARIQGRMDVQGLVSAALNGYLVWAATCQLPTIGSASGRTPLANVASGAMCLRVVQAQFGIGGFRANGTLTLANNADTTCAGSSQTPSAATLSAQVDILLGRQGSANIVTVSGTVAADGTYRLTGRSRVEIGGVALDLEATASKNSEGARIQGAADLSVLGNSVRISGAFQSTSSGPSVTMAASVSPLRIGGFSLGSGQIRLYQGPGFNGMSFDASMNLGIVRFASTITFRQSGSTFLFYTAAALRLGIPGVAQVSAQGLLTNCSDPACSGVGQIRLTASASLDLGRWRVTTPRFEINTSGRFSIRVKEGRRGLSTGRTGVLGVDWWIDDASWSIDITIDESGLRGSARGSARIYSQETALKYPCGPWYWVFRDWCDYPRTNWGSFGASASFNPWAFCFNVAGSPDICLRI